MKPRLSSHDQLAVLIRDHPEGRNKIQDHYKSELYVMEVEALGPECL